MSSNAGAAKAEISKLASHPLVGSYIGFLKNCRNFAKACKKPSRSELGAILRGNLVGLCFLGFFAYVVKVVHIPINNIITGASSQ